MNYITPATTDHIPLIRKLAQRIWPAAYRDILLPEQIENMLTRIYSDDNLAEEMRQGHHFWIIYEENVPSGYASAFKEVDTIWIKKLYVDLGHQRSGLGSALMQKAIHDLSPASDIKLLVNKNNTPAKSFYEHKGFTLAGETAVTMGDYAFCDHIYSRTLNAK